MPFMQMNLGEDVAEPKPVAKGRYTLTITDVQDVSKEGKVTFQVSCAIEGHETAPNVRHWLSFPVAGDEAGKAYFKQLSVKRFLNLFGISFEAEGFNTDDLLGATAENVELGLEENEGNLYNRIVVPRLPGEADAKAGVTKPSPKRKSA